MSEFSWFPVRCCCQPQTIFGFLRLPQIGTKHNVLDLKGERHSVELRSMAQTLCVSNDYTQVIDLAPEYKNQIEMAVYSDDRPIEFWLTIPGFVQSVQGERS